MQTGCLTERGQVRELNEDAYGLLEEAGITFLMVADGMGGHNAGEVASQLAVHTIKAFLQEHAGMRNIPALLDRALAEANRAVFQKSCLDRDCTAMGTTVVLCALDGEQAYIANIGDSRAYLLNDHITRITVDHSVVEELLLQGEISPEEALVHPQKNMITRAVGTKPQEQADLFSCTLEPGDSLLLCSDGLSSMLSDEEILELYSREGTIDARLRRLVDEANARGGYDNITVLAARNSEVEA